MLQLERVERVWDVCYGAPSVRRTTIQTVFHWESRTRVLGWFDRPVLTEATDDRGNDLRPSRQPKTQHPFRRADYLDLDRNGRAFRSYHHLQFELGWLPMEARGIGRLGGHIRLVTADRVRTVRAPAARGAARRVAFEDGSYEVVSIRRFGEDNLVVKSRIRVPMFELGAKQRAFFRERLLGPGGRPLPSDGHWTVRREGREWVRRTVYIDVPKKARIESVALDYVAGIRVRLYPFQFEGIKCR